jgi:hypothetical protein
MYADPKFRPIPLEAVTLLNEGQTVQAIKVVRQAEGLGLKEAKGRVEAYIAHEPLLRAQLEHRQRAVRRKFFFWFVLADAIIIGGVVWWLSNRGMI